MNELSNEEAKLLTQPITESEIKNAITKIKNNKTLGTDSFSGVYYKIFMNELTPILFNGKQQEQMGQKHRIIPKTKNQKNFSNV